MDEFVSVFHLCNVPLDNFYWQQQKIKKKRVEARPDMFQLRVSSTL